MKTTTDIDRSSIIEQAAISCLDEMYRASQPSLTWQEVQNIAAIYPNKKIWAEHYLPAEMYNEILSKYEAAYAICSEWDDDVNLVLEYLTEGGTRDKYILPQTDENGNYHPGYRGYEKVAPIREQIKEKLDSLNINIDTTGISNDITNTICETINHCKNFYVKNRNEMSFRMTVSNYAPSTSYQNVKDIWEDMDPTVQIEELERIYDEDKEGYIWVKKSEIEKINELGKE